jgi:hypothetical protein
MKRRLSPPVEVIDLTGSPPASKVAKKAAIQLSTTPRTAGERRQPSQSPRRGFNSQQREQSGGDNPWYGFPGADVFSHPSQRFRVAFNPDPDFFTPVAEELARALPEPKPGNKVPSLSLDNSSR